MAKPQTEDVVVNVSVSFTDDFFTRLRNAVTEAIIHANKAGEDPNEGFVPAPETSTSYDDVRAQVQNMMNKAKEHGDGREKRVENAIRAVFNDIGKATVLMDIEENKLGLVLKALKDIGYNG